MTWFARNNTAPTLQEEADAWLLRLRSGAATPGDLEAFKRWKSASPGHAIALATAVRAWEDLGQAGAAFRAAGSRRAAMRSNPLQRRMVLGALASGAGAAALVAVVAPPLGLWPSMGEFSADYRTATGETRHLALLDRVDVNLNTQSSIKVRPGGPGDEIELVSGEASVGREGTGQVMAVVAGAGRTVMVDGEIEIRRFGDSRVCVSCLRGAARVSHATGAVTLRARQQVSYTHDGIGAAAPFDMTALSPWRDGVVLFRDTPLAEVVEEINRYRPGRVILMGDRLAGRKVSGRFQVARLDVALERIEEAFGARVRRLPAGVVLLS